MHTTKWPRPLIAGLLVLAMVVSLSGLLGAAGTTIRIASPKAGAKVSGMITIQASVKTDEQIGYVILGIDDDRPQSSNSAPFSFDVDTRELTDGPHRVFVEAYDRYGLVGSSSVVTINVKNGSPMVQVKKAPATQIAAKPQPAKQVAVAPTPAKVAIAKAPPASAARSASSDVKGAARTASTPESFEDVEAVSPMMSGRGPIPAPTHSAAETKIASTRPGAQALASDRNVIGGPLGSAPPMPRIASATPAKSELRTHMVVLNGRTVEFDVAPTIANGRMQVPFRSMFESQGARVKWNAGTRTATSVKGALTVEVPVGTQLARVNGREVDMGCPATIAQGRTIIPIRFFGAATGADVYWNSLTRTAMVVTTGERAIAERLH